MDKATIIRTIAAVIVSIIDLVVILTGVDISITEEQILAIVSVIVGAWIWWKNNSMTTSAQKADKIMKALKKTIKDNDLALLDKVEHVLKEAERND